MIQITNFRGDLSNISAQTATLVTGRNVVNNALFANKRSILDSESIKWLVTAIETAEQ